MEPLAQKDVFHDSRTLGFHEFSMNPWGVGGWPAKYVVVGETGGDG